MSDVQQGHDWWMAADGKWYPPERHPDYVPPSAVPPPPATTAAAETTSQQPPNPPVGTPAGWYRDPTDPWLARLWDGTAWTESRSTDPDSATQVLEQEQPAQAQPPQSSLPVLAPTTAIAAQGQWAGPPRAVPKIRNPWMVILLYIVTLGIYGLYWYYMTYKEMQDYSNRGIGGVVGLALAFTILPMNWFVLPSEVGNLYAAEGAAKPVQGIVGLWFLLPIIGPLIWVLQVQGALSRFWTAHGFYAGQTSI